MCTCPAKNALEEIEEKSRDSLSLAVGALLFAVWPVRAPIHHMLRQLLHRLSRSPLPYQPTPHHSLFYEQTVDTRLHISPRSSYGLLVLKLVL